MSQALDGVRVLDLAEFVAGPYCAKLFGDFGADVIKVEPQVGDVARRVGPFPGDIPDPEKSGLFLHLNANKRGIRLNLESDTGRSILSELMSVSDIVVTSFSPARLESLELTFEELSRRHPSLVTVAITNFGLWGPYRDYEASEIVLYAMGHSMSSTGLPERPPIKMAGYLTQYQSGSVAAAAGLGAYFGRLSTGEGELLDVSMMEVQAGGSDRRNTFLTRYQYTGETVLREHQDRAPGVLPSGFHPCQDGWVQGGFTVQHWKGFVGILERPELLDEPPFTNPEVDLLDMRYKDWLEGLFYDWLGPRTRRQAMEDAQRGGAMLLPVNNLSDVLQDEHLSARDYWVEADHPTAGRLTYPGTVLRLEEGGYTFRRPAPFWESIRLTSFAGCWATARRTWPGFPRKA